MQVNQGVNTLTGTTNQLVGTTNSLSGATFITSGSGANASSVSFDNGVNAISGASNTITGATQVTSGAASVSVNNGVNTLTGVTNTLTGTTNNLNATNNNITGITQVTSGAASVSVNNGTNTVTGVNNVITGTNNAINGATQVTSGAASVSVNNGTNTVTGMVNNISGTTNNLTGTNNNITGVTQIVSGSSNASFNNGANVIRGLTNTVTGNTNTVQAGPDNQLVVDAVTGTTITSGSGANRSTVSFNQGVNSLVGTTNSLTASMNVITGNTTINAAAADHDKTTVVGSSQAGTGSVHLQNGANTTLRVSNGQIAASAGGGVHNGQFTLASEQATVGVAGSASSFSATPSSAVVSGGSNTQYTTMTLNGNGAQFANPVGGPARVTGIADGRSPYDAVNFRQLAGGLAAAAAMANLPMIAHDRDVSFGIGWGHYQGYNGLAIGGQYRFSPNGVARLSMTGTLERNLPYTVGGGVSWSW